MGALGDLQRFPEPVRTPISQGVTLRELLETGVPNCVRAQLTTLRRVNLKFAEQRVRKDKEAGVAGVIAVVDLDRRLTGAWSTRRSMMP